MKSTFTILHTNDIHSNLIGTKYPSGNGTGIQNDDSMRGGFARLSTLIAQRRAARISQGPVLVLDGGDYSMGTAFGAATRECGAELQLLSKLGYDATTFGNHDFDLGPDGTALSISKAVAAGHCPWVVASNTCISGNDPSLLGLQRLTEQGVVRRYLVIERGGIRFGIFGVLGVEAQHYTDGAGAVTFTDPVETAAEIVDLLRKGEKVDVVIALSHGGMVKDDTGRFTDGEDVQLVRAVPGIDVVIGSHSHTELHQPIIVNNHSPVVQTGKLGECLGELVVTLEDGELKVDSYKLHPVDGTLVGDELIAVEIAKFAEIASEAVFASRGYRIDQPLVIIDQDFPNTFSDIAASTPLANLCTDAYRAATGADVGFSANGMMRCGLIRGKTGVQTVYDVFAVAPLGAGIIDKTAGSALVTGYFFGNEIKQLLEFFLVDNPAHPGEFFPRASGMRFHYDLSRPKFDVVTAVELGNIDCGYQAIDITGSDARLYSVTCPLMLAVIIAAIPKYTKGALTLAAKNSQGQRLKSRVEALEVRRESTAAMGAPRGSIDTTCVATTTDADNRREIKEWQAIMDYIRGLPVRAPDVLPTMRVDARAMEVRAVVTH